MSKYQATFREMQFVLQELAGLSSVPKFPSIAGRSAL